GGGARVGTDLGIRVRRRDRVRRRRPGGRLQSIGSQSAPGDDGAGSAVRPSGQDDHVPGRVPRAGGAPAPDRGPLPERRPRSRPIDLNPTTKLAAAVAGTALALAWGGWVAVAVVVVCALAALRAGKLRRVAVAALALVPVALSSLVINALLPA